MFTRSIAITTRSMAAIAEASCYVTVLRIQHDMFVDRHSPLSGISFIATGEVRNPLALRILQPPRMEPSET